MMQVHIGTSGWVYPHWRGRFYPETLPEHDWLGFYARHFSSVEINCSFYRLPTNAVFAHWRDATPAGFIFSVKSSRFITHMKKLTEPAQTLPPLLDAVSGLGDKLGPLLFQLPPNWRVNLGRLREFLEALPRGLRVAFELRDPSWHCREVFDLLAEHNAAFCIYDLAGIESPRRLTADFTYLRLHGPGTAYCGRYGSRALHEWADWLSRQKLTAAYVYFDNDEAAYAVRDAAELQRLLSG